MRHFLTALFLLCFITPSFAGINTWTQCTATDGQSIASLLIDTTTSGRIYAGAYGGIFKSEDYGTTWIFSSFTISPYYNLEVDSIAVTPKSPNIVYTYMSNGGGILKNTTLGYGDWQPITNDLSDACSVPNLLIDPENVGRMYVGACLSGGTFIYRSDDTGYTWTSSMSGITTDQGVNILIMDPIQHNKLYAGTGGSPGVYVSLDGATSWNSIPFYWTVNSLAVDPTNINNIYVGMETNGFASSFDGGSTWSLCTNNSIILGSTLLSILINPLNPEIIYVGLNYNSGGGVLKSKDQGNTWSYITTGLPPRQIPALAYDTVTRTLFAGTVDEIPPNDTPIGVWMYQDTDLTTAVEDWEKYDW